jgi:hypothetical protein
MKIGMDARKRMAKACRAILRLARCISEKVRQ